MNTKVLKTFLLIFCSIVDICLLLIHAHFKHLIILILYNYNCVNLMSMSFILMSILMSTLCCQFNVQNKHKEENSSKSRLYRFVTPQNEANFFFCDQHETFIVSRLDQKDLNE